MHDQNIAVFTPYGLFWSVGLRRVVIEMGAVKSMFFEFQKSDVPRYAKTVSRSALKLSESSLGLQKTPWAKFHRNWRWSGCEKWIGKYSVPMYAGTLYQGQHKHTLFPVPTTLFSTAVLCRRRHWSQWAGKAICRCFLAGRTHCGQQWRNFWFWDGVALTCEGRLWRARGDYPFFPKPVGTASGGVPLRRFATFLFSPSLCGLPLSLTLCDNWLVTHSPLWVS